MERDELEDYGVEGDMDAFISERLSLLRSKEGKQVVSAGVIPAHAFKPGWPNRVTDQVVIIKERRNHYLEQHPEIEPDVHELLLIRAILHPQEVHRNKRDASIALIYQTIPEGRAHYLRIALWISNDPVLQNSVHSMRFARLKEILDGRDADRKMWP